MGFNSRFKLKRRRATKPIDEKKRQVTQKRDEASIVRADSCSRATQAQSVEDLFQVFTENRRFCLPRRTPIVKTLKVFPELQFEEQHNKTTTEYDLLPRRPRKTHTLEA